MELQPYAVLVRLKGLRASYPISPAAIFNRAVLLEIERRREEKKAAKLKKRKT